MPFLSFRITIDVMADLEPEPHDPINSVSGHARLILPGISVKQVKEEEDDTLENVPPPP